MNVNNQYLARLGVLEELEIHGEAIGDAGPDLGNHVEEDTDGVAAADGVAVLLEVGRESGGVHTLNYVHASVIKGLAFLWSINIGM